MADPRLTHIGLCVTDLDRSLRFWCDGVGFAVVGHLTAADAQTAQLLDVPDVEVELIYLERDGVRIELLGYLTPPPEPAEPVRPMTRPGFTHLSFRVDDAQAMADAIVAHGGRHLTEATVTFRHGNRGMMLLDPDDNRIELIERVPSQPSKTPGDAE
ncbi:VOC family protein [uncultured Williamsia sp.]|uniref:VOC family protein n=1 Tax=uncultured Williamsia sp. TaxID=259311 RepID=UPI00262EF755|nr:VOC family protein [uncultured Williamsia sp.]